MSDTRPSAGLGAPALSRRSLSVALIDDEIVVRMGVGAIADLVEDHDVGDPMIFARSVVHELTTGYGGEPSAIDDAFELAIDRALEAFTLHRAKASPPTPAEAGPP